MANSQKDTIYVDIDDEITGLIEKVRTSKQKIVALVLPKRAAVLQSVVNMKLLKKTSEDTKKHIVLITSEASILPLAGMVGFHVARTLQSKPAVPVAPVTADAGIIETREVPEAAVPAVDPSRPVGELAGITPDDEDETIEVDNEEVAEDAVVPEKAAPNKKLKIPNFNKFRLWIFLGGALLLLLIVGWVFAATVLPTAKITIKTDTSSYNSDINFTTGPKIATLNTEGLIVPAVSKELKKTDSEKVATTGQKDMGEKAKGTISLKNCTKTDESLTVPAGTGVSTSSLTFITLAETTLPASTFSGGGSCTTSLTDVDVIAQSAGDKFNISDGRTFSVAGFSSVSGTNKEAMSGGTTKIVKVVSQSDIDIAKQKLAERANSTATEELQKMLDGENLIGVAETLVAGTPAVTSVPKIEDEASEVTVTSITTFTMLGLKEDDLKQVVEADVNTKIDKSKQDILDNGLDKVIFKILEKKPNGEMRLNMQVVATAGPELDAEEIKKEIAGKKKGETQSIIQSRPGIRDVDINYSPFWVYSTPKKLNKITIEFQNNDAGNR